MNLEKLYPYVVPEGYVKQMRCPADFVRPLGHGVFVILAEDSPEIIAMHSPGTISATGLTFDQAHERALNNLEQFTSGQNFVPEGHQFPDGTPFIVFSGHWLIGSCVILPNLYSWATEALKNEHVLASVPEREFLILFPRKDRVFRDAMRLLIAESSQDARKPITAELFELTAKGILPFSEQSTPIS